MKGYLYILENPALRQNFLKIGLTTVDPNDRARGLSKSSSIPLNFKLRYSVTVSDVKVAESRAHLMLDEFRVNPQKEFFCLSLKKAMQMCDAIAGYELEDLSICGSIKVHNKLLGARYGATIRLKDQQLLYTLMGATANKTPFDHIMRTRRGIVDGFMTSEQVAEVFGVTKATARRKMARLETRGKAAVCSPFADESVGPVFEFIRYHEGHLAWRFTDEFRRQFWNFKI
ncbi:MAG TPA: GIY-YIG nuclease family protein [Paucimonas sp.]|nr:GIY-YIG nuclease family protein [Paucimonas sp.]